MNKFIRSFDLFQGGNIMDKFARYLCLVIMTCIFGMTGLFVQNVHAAQLSTTTDCDEKVITVTSSNGDTKVQYSFDNKAWIYAVKSNNDWIIDISNVSESKDSKIYLKGDKSTTNMVLVIRKALNCGIKGVYSGIATSDYKEGSVNITTGSVFQYRTYNVAKWISSSNLSSNKIIPVSHLESFGGNVYIREPMKVVANSTMVSITRPSKILTVKVPKAASAPGVKINALTGKMTGINKSTMEIKVENNSTFIDLSAKLGADNYTSRGAGWYGTNLTTLDVTKLASDASVTISVRVAAKAKTPASRIKEFEIEKVAPVPTNVIDNSTNTSVNVKLSYVNQTIIVDSLKKYEYTILANSIPMTDKTSWTLLATTSTSIEAAVTKVATNSTIYVRVKGINATAKNDAVLPSLSATYPCNKRPALLAISYNSSLQSVINSNTKTAIEYTLDKTKWAEPTAVKTKLTTDSDIAQFSVEDLLSETATVNLYLRIPASNTNKTFPSIVKTLALPSPTVEAKLRKSLGEMLDYMVPTSGALILKYIPSLNQGLNMALNDNGGNSAGNIKIGFVLSGNSGATATMGCEYTTSTGKVGVRKLTLTINKPSINVNNIMAGNRVYSANGNSLDQVIAHETLHGIMQIAVSKGMSGSDTFPQWFIEGTAQMAGGVTKSWSDQLNTSSETAFKTDVNGSFTKGTPEDKYCMGYFATMYLSYAASGKSITDLESMNETDFIANIRTGLNNILNQVVNGNSLNTAISNTTAGKPITFGSIDNFTSKAKNEQSAEFYKFALKVKTFMGSSNNAAGSILATALSVTTDNILKGEAVSASRLVFDKTVDKGVNEVKNVFVGGGRTQAAASSYGETNVTNKTIIYDFINRLK